MDTRWKMSSFSAGAHNCVEVANTGAELLVRDSKNPAGPRLTAGFALLEAIKTGRLAG